VDRNSFGIRFVCAVALLCATASTLAAQDQPPPSQQPRGGPFSGLFKGSPKEQPHTLDVRASAFGAYDDNLLAQTPGFGGSTASLLDSRNQRRGISSGMDASLRYGFRTSGTRSAFNIGGGASVQQFGSQVLAGGLWIPSYSATTGFRTSLTTKTALLFGADTSYGPYYQYLPFLKDTASEESPVGADYGFAAQTQWVRSVGGSASIENRFSRKSMMSAGVNWQQHGIPSISGSSIDSRGAHAGFSHNLTRKLAFHFGYGVQETSSPNSEPIRTNNLDVGLGYGDGITLTIGRHYILSLSAGVTVAKNGDAAAVLRTGKSTAVAVTGGATLSRSIGRDWGVSIGYARGTSYVVGFAEPLMNDSANAGIGGPLGDRMQFSAGAGASRGQALFSENRNPIVSYSASTRLSYGLFKYLGLYAQASYYRYSVPIDYLTIGFVPDLDRRSASVGLSSWFPLIKHRRGSRDSG